MFADLTPFPDQASTLAPEVDAAFTFVLGVTIFFTLLIAALIIRFMVKYRRRPGIEPAKGYEGSLKLEIAWSVVPLLIALFIFWSGAKVYLTWAEPPDDALQIYVVGQQWMWKFQHLGGQREINQLHVPVNRPVKLTLTSQDVIHSFFVPEFRAHMDAIPGRYTTFWFTATKTGKFNLFCAEYCGTDHSAMIGEVRVLSQKEYEEWLTEKADNSMANKGRKLFQKLQCVACHTGDARAKGPLLENIYLKPIPIQGRTKPVVADDAYLRESILYPDRKVVVGFQPIMPSFESEINEEEVLQLLAYLRSLRAGDTPDRVEDAEPPVASPGKDDKAKNPGKK
jgi:cytochrome c oxidase subunit 2